MKRRQQVIISAATTLIMTGIMQVQGNLLVERGFHIVTFELAKTPQRVREIIETWHTEGVAVAQWNTFIDFIFIATYVSFGFFASLALTEKDNNLFIRQVGKLMSKAIILAGIFDIAENLCMLRTLYGSVQDNTILFTYWFAWTKFVLIVFVVITSIVLLTKNLVNKLTI